MKTNFSFELYFTNASQKPADERAAVMRDLGTLLEQALLPRDAQARVTVTDSHKGSDNKIAELTTTLTDAELGGVLQPFCQAQGLTLDALE